MEAILHGILLAFGLILPLGVQNVFVFSQGASQPRLIRAFPAVIAAAFCDTVLIGLAVFGVSAIVLQIEMLRHLLMGAGAIFLVYMGFVLWRASSKASDLLQPQKKESAQALPFSKQIIFAVSVSLLNPHALLDTIGVIGTSGLAYSGADKINFAAACIAVSWIWFIGLACAGATLRRFDTHGRALNVFNRISALFIWGMALFLLWRLFVG
ncbi:LysE/ArgO family amino acid transporter [Saccharibacillus sp. JS10]|uniref:LysE/ArgO family amino acid transporter n=1 Tax=Saccharibacillus sp. JS10 TaxID=2950552 RepID=UPI00210A5A2D|nr:LysE/ArgO family amino acid transporter [Saccharibacillus sp. JS10]MCQ4088015.1 LysE/ArgO family amino acid transporter [Saccharibacillus sp. JS10]